MAIDTIMTSRSYLTKQLTALNNSMTERTTQLASGKSSTTYGGIGDNRLLDLQLTQKVSRISSYQETITNANLHIKSLNLTLERLESSRVDAKATFDSNNFIMQSDGQTQTQATAEVLLHETVNLLNTEVAGYYLYGGSDANSNPVATVKELLDGAGGLSGLRTVMDEYAQANLGVNNNGRLDVSAMTTNYVLAVPTDSTFTITEDGAHDFGFDISAVTSTLTNVAVTGPAAADPDSFDVQFTGQPVLGETISIELTLPPAHTDTFTLELKASDTAGEGDFVVGADLEETATNLRDAISAGLEKEAQTSLKAIANNWAADEFFDTYNGAVPQRVDGPPFDTATALIAGGATTLAWYTGENTTTTNPREDKNAVIDTNLTVNYGARANEKGPTDLLRTLATFVAADFSGGTSIDEEYYNSLTKDLRAILEPPGADQSGIADISTEVAIAYRTVQTTDLRHTQMKSSYQGTIGEIEGVDKEQLAAEILQLQTNIEAAYRASAIVLQLSLADYL